ncbi:MAG: nitrogenase cofactor biosynthesis protein NifB [Zoogloeaceae bacterium]|nr:nitrogenase cofactor biosynthesis protein NifB [Rhodocyclaceae bacterium]MCP5235855.1 nitrogenase cofactor biosynthesis protein NifB [Zoogloeaceae bacterium]
MELPVIGQMPAESAGGGCSASSCGSSGEQLSHLPDAIRAKVQDHPCYSEDAHHYFARMHVAVAPACNIQCHYCNRKYDCSNESRPGVVSELLTPDQAVLKTKAVAAAIPQMSVLGIAGPGDPLANPQRTFETFRRLSAEAPDIKLCVSTNGLALPESVEELARHNIDHVTITINCLDPEIGARIYPWIFWQNKRVFGVEAARILIEQQQKGLEMLTARGILVKVNSVMIPGINDQHLKEVSRVVKAKGAFLHNVMPLIAEAEHGTFYGLTGQRGPTADELQDLQDACAGDMNMMRHCRQCRADAVGLLGEDRGEEFTLDKIAAMDIDYDKAMQVRAEVRAGITAELNARRAEREQAAAPVLRTDLRPIRIAVASSGQGLVNQHFGHAREFLVYEASSAGVRFLAPRKTDLYCAGDDTCGDGESVLDRTIAALSDCEVVLCSKIGFEPWGRLEEAGIMPNGEHAMEQIEAACAAVYDELAASGVLAVAGGKNDRAA